MTTILGVCERCDSPLERGDLRCAICGMAVPFDVGEHEGVAIEVMRCDDCGAVVEYDPGRGAPHCAFCDATMHLERIEDPVEQTELTLPFTIDADEAQRTVRRWLGSLGWFRPGDLKTKAKVQGVRPLWWVAWVFDADVLISWAGDSNAGGRRSVWAPHAGQSRVTFDDILVSASRGLSEEEVGRLTPTFDLASAAVEVAPLDDATVEQFDVQRSQARERILATVRSRAAKIVEERLIPGSSSRKISVEPLLRGLVTRRYAFPAWVLAYRYEDRVYRAVVSGQDASVVIGKAPWSVARILLAVLGGLALVGLAALAIALG